MKKITKYRASVLLLLTLISHSLFSQSGDEQLASQYFQNKEYDKAVVYYEKLFAKNPNQFYQNYLSCLIETKDEKKAEKMVKKVIKQNPGVPNFQIDLGYVYKVFEEADKSKKEFDGVIKSLPADQMIIIDAAKSFIAIKEWDYAIASYLRGRKLLGDIYPFNFELAEAYESKGDLTSMINEYLDVLEMSEAYIQAVQNALQTTFGIEGDNTKNEILRTELLKRVQNSSSSIFSELLIWMMIQQKDFDGAYIQSKAIDKRKKEDGSRIFSLGELCQSNELYETATKCYQYVIDKGREFPYYNLARMQILEVMYKKIANTNNYSQADLLTLEKTYLTSIDEMGKNAGTVSMLKSLAHLEAFYIHNTNKAIEILNEAINIPRIPINTQAECKLELGDILLLTGDIWEASLTYSQVEKSFKHDPIGQEAKFRNAKISYYTGDFKWAQAQLDVLKASTSKLISNDAMYLSLIISDNTVEDTNTTPLLIFSRADLLSFQNKDSMALTLLDSLNFIFPVHTLSDDILYKKAQIMMKKANYQSAVELLDKIVANYSFDILADDALYQLASIYDYKFKNKEKAMHYYEEILTQHPGSLYVTESRKRYRELRGDIIN